MNKTITWTIIGILVLVVIAFGVWRFMSPSEVLAPVSESEENNSQEDGSDENDGMPNGQFVQQAPGTDTMGDEDVSDEEDSTEDSENEVTISMTDSGFSPATVTVPVGTKVTFVNNGQALHWPASDSHPTHNVLPEFDSMKGLSTGENYSYTFDKAGEWEFHDHLNAQFSGTIIVE